MEIKIEETATKGAFYIEKGGIRVAEMIFSKAGAGLIVIEHTEVSDSLRGTGAGKQLVGKAVEYARSLRWKVVPLCPFANKVFERVPEYGDVLR